MQKVPGLTSFAQHNTQQSRLFAERPSCDAKRHHLLLVDHALLDLH
jgi:hypothetical protein